MKMAKAKKTQIVPKPFRTFSQKFADTARTDDTIFGLLMHVDQEHRDKLGHAKQLTKKKKQKTLIHK